MDSIGATSLTVSSHFQGSGFRVQGWRVQGSGSRVQGSGLSVQGQQLLMNSLGGTLFTLLSLPCVFNLNTIGNESFHTDAELSLLLSTCVVFFLLLKRVH